MRSVNINFNQNGVEYFGQKDNKTVISQKMRQDGKSLRKYNAFNFVNFAQFSEIWPFFSFTYFLTFEGQKLKFTFQKSEFSHTFLLSFLPWKIISF